jgi:hypothetical protein
MVNSRRRTCAGRAGCMEEKKNAYKVFGQKIWWRETVQKA